MGATIDHVGIPATDPEAAASFLAWVLGEGVVRADGPPGDGGRDMFSLFLDGWSLAYVRVPQPARQHLAIRVGEGTFDAAVERLTGRGIPFGNDPENPANGHRDDPLGGAGRAYFTDPDGHLFELVASS
ncbi:MAG: VOC family protein [Acidimicrobiales bacterium]